MCLKGLYPWGGDIEEGNPKSSVAVVTMSERIKLPEDKVALWGRMMTENLGVEKVVANIISNPRIRHLVLFGKDIRGHKSGETLLCLHRNGIDEDNRVKETTGAMPYIENIDTDAIERFQKQIEIVNLLGVTDDNVLLKALDDLLALGLPPFGEPYIAIRITRSKRHMEGMECRIALYKDIVVDPLGAVDTLEVD